jgi:SAM-dependent methyltransferase
MMHQETDTALEPKMAPLYEAVLEELAIGAGTERLDVGSGSALFSRLAAARGAEVTGVGELESLPFADASFDVVTGFNAFQSADQAGTLREAARVGRGRAAIVIATWGAPAHCEAAACMGAVGALLPPPRRAPDPFALSGEGALEEFAKRGGLMPEGDRRDILCVWGFRDEREALRDLRSARFAAEAAEVAGEYEVAGALLGALAPYRTSDGGYRLENTFTYVVTRKEGCNESHENEGRWL